MAGATATPLHASSISGNTTAAGLPVHAAALNLSSAGNHSLLAGGLNGSLLNGTNSTIRYKDVEEDRIAPGYAALLLYLMLFMILGAQTGLVLWQRKHKRSYDLVSLAGMWLMPAIISFHLKFWRFLAIWAIYSTITGYLLSLCMNKKMHHTTPRKVYGWFLGAYKVSVAVGVTGYILLVLEMFGVGLLLARFLERGLALVLLWYGLYFGILGRDLAEVASEQMSNTIGSGKRLTSTVNSCGICGGELNDFSHLGEEGAGERVRQLNCKHCFHELCIRGWTIVGKKDVCPVCLEKVDMRDLYADKPWETQNLSWIEMLNAIRYMVVWNPVIFLVLSVLTHIMPHQHVTRHIPVAAQAFARSPGVGLMAPPSPLDSVDMGGLAGGA